MGRRPTQETPAAGSLIGEWEQRSAADVTATQLHLRLQLSGPDDDIALVAVRAHPEDRPRPPEAGPSLEPADLRGR